MILLLWVYYSCQILLLGAEFTRVYAERRGITLQTAAFASNDVGLRSETNPASLRPLEEP